MGQQMVWHALDLAEHGDGPLQIAGVPQDDGGDDQVEAGGAMLLVLVGPITNLAQAMNEHGAGEAVAGLAFVQFLAGRAAQLGLLDPVEREQGAL